MEDLVRTGGIAALVALASFGLLSAVILPTLEAARLRKRRLSLAVGGALGVNPSKTKKDSSGKSDRQRNIQKALNELDNRRDEVLNRRDKPSLFKRLQEAGLKISVKSYWIATLISIVVSIGVLAILVPQLPIAYLGFGFAIGILVPHVIISIIRRRRLKKLESAFPDAIDTIVRGVRAGRPLADCLTIVASDSEDPIKSEFHQTVEDGMIGVPIDEAVERLANRIPLPEVNFFAIVISIQKQTGGSLTETLSNLSTLLRARRQFRNKVKTMSSEAKASAGIIGSLPIAVALILQFVSPDYIALLFTTNLGNIALVISALWMGLGVLVMRNMINFDM